MPAALIGTILGFCNVIFIAVGLQWRDPHLHSDLVISFGLVPGLITGVVCGWIADATVSLSPWPRRVVLALAPFGMVGFLAGTFDLGQHMLVAMIPTLVAVMLLERWTRSSTPLPAATVERA